MSEDLSEQMIRDIWHDVVSIHREVGKIETIGHTVDEIKTEMKEQRDQIGKMRETVAEHSHDLRDLKERQPQLSQDEVDEIRTLVSRHRWVSGLVAAGITSAVALIVLEVGPAIIHALGVATGTQ